MKKRTRSHTEEGPSTNSSSGWNKQKSLKAQGEEFLRDTRGIDTVALKIVFYLAITGTILILVASSWGNVSPFLEKARTDEQAKDLSVELLSIQNGYARNLGDITAVQGSSCIARLSLPDNVRFLALGIDPDPDSDGNLTNSAWNVENGSILIQYNSGEKNRFLIDDGIRFRTGTYDNGIWVPDDSHDPENAGILIENPVDGDFTFELVYDESGKYTLSRF